MTKTVALIVVVAAFSTCCNRGTTTTTTGRPTVAFVLKTLNHPFFVDMRRGAQEAADRLGVTLQVQAAEREIDVEKQMQIVENLIQTGIQALCITPSGSREIVSALVKARNAKVPIIVVDTRVDPKAAADAGLRTETFVGSDNYAGGTLAGQYLVKVSGGKARVGILEGIPGHETGDSRMRGFRDFLKSSPGITIVASQPANWERDQGFNVFQNMLQAHPDIDSVFACSDLMALGAIEAIAAAGKTGKIKVIGFDALDDAKTAIAAGTMEASVAQFPSEMGRAAVESAVKVIRGESVPADIKVKLELVTRQLPKPVSLQMKDVFGGSALGAVLAAAKRPPRNEDSPRRLAGPSLGRRFVTENVK
jgi:ribose transport system substrate-binding protein